MPISKDSKMSNSSLATYGTFPVILKFIQVVLGIVCVVVAAYDLIQNSEDLAARSALTITGSQIRSFGKNLLKTALIYLMTTEYTEYVFIDQMVCRIIFLTVTTLLLAISFIQLTWFPVSLFTGPMKSRIISGVVYHLIGFGLHLAISMNLFARMKLFKTHFYNENLMRDIAYVGIAEAALYLLSAVTAVWYLRGCRSYGGKIVPKQYLNA